MYKMALVLLAAFSLLFSAYTWASAGRDGGGRGHDMFRKIEKFERSISYKRELGNPLKYRGCHDTGCTFCIPYESPCKAAARMYEDPVQHGTPVVSEDDY